MGGANIFGDIRGGACLVLALRAGRRAPLGCCFREHSIDLLLSAWQCTARVRDMRGAFCQSESSLHSSYEINCRPGRALKPSLALFILLANMFPAPGAIPGTGGLLPQLGLLGPGPYCSAR